ncbi:hypothetical protein LTR94_032772, partial [Friedmanniomyces endolithicus]
LVVSEKGRGGGWRLAKPLASVSLAMVHSALGEPVIVPETPPVEAEGCLVEASVNEALGDAYRAAHALIMARLEA